MREMRAIDPTWRARKFGGWAAVSSNCLRQHPPLERGGPAHRLRDRSIILGFVDGRHAQRGDLGAQTVEVSLVVFLVILGR